MGQMRCGRELWLDAEIHWPIGLMAVWYCDVCPHMRRMVRTDKTSGALGLAYADI